MLSDGEPCTPAELGVASAGVRSLCLSCCNSEVRKSLLLPKKSIKEVYPPQKWEPFGSSSSLHITLSAVFYLLYDSL